MIFVLLILTILALQNPSIDLLQMFIGGYGYYVNLQSFQEVSTMLSAHWYCTYSFPRRLDFTFIPASNGDRIFS